MQLLNYHFFHESIILLRFSSLSISLWFLQHRISTLASWSSNLVLSFLLINTLTSSSFSTIVTIVKQSHFILFYLTLMISYLSNISHRTINQFKQILTFIIICFTNKLSIHLESLSRIPWSILIQRIPMKSDNICLVFSRLHFFCKSLISKNLLFFENILSESNFNFYLGLRIYNATFWFAVINKEFLVFY